MSCGFKGSFEVFQNKDFLKIISEYYGQVVVDLHPVLILMNKHRLLGYTSGTVGNPETVASYQDWRSLLKGLNCAHLTIHTEQWIEEWTPYLISPRDNHNIYLDLSQGKEYLFRNFSKRCRETIRAGLRKGVEISVSEKREDLYNFYKIMMEMSSNGKKFEVPDFQLLDILLPTPFAKFFTAKAGSTLIGGNLCLLSRNIHAWIGGISPQFKSFSAGNLLDYETMCWAVDNDYGYFDMGQQSLTGLDTITQYKMSFNPLLKKAYTYRVFFHFFKRFLLSISRSLK